MKLSICQNYFSPFYMITLHCDGGVEGRAQWARSDEEIRVAVEFLTGLVLDCFQQQLSTQ